MLKQIFILVICTNFSINYLNSQISNPELLYTGVGNIKDALYSDFNNDSIPDLIVSRRPSSGSLTGLTMLCFGYYNEFNQIAFTEDTIVQKTFDNIFLYDFDEDSDEDLVALGGQSGECISIYRNDFNTFTFTLDIPKIFTDSCLNLLEIIDINHDGKKDLFFIETKNYSDNGKLAINTGQGQFLISDLATYNGDYFITDVNNDNIDDFIFENPSKREILYLRSNLNTYTTIRLDSTFTYNKNIVDVGDYNGDNEMDYCYLNRDTDSIYIVFSCDINRKSTMILHHIEGSPYFVDINKDGIKDIYIKRIHNHQLFINDGMGNFIFETKVDKIQPHYPSSKIIYENFDTLTNKSTYIEFNESRVGVFEILDNKPIFYLGIFESSIFESLDDFESRDIDYDGTPDLVICSRSAGKISYLKGLKNKKFAQKLINIVSDELGVMNFTFADFNKDGLQDIMYSSFDAGNLIIKYGNADGTFGNKNYLARDVNLLISSSAADYENDGYPDIIYSSNNDSVVYFISNKLGEFQDQILLSSQYEYSRLISKDLDKDGDIDFLIEDYNNLNVGNFVGFINDGQGNFSLSNDVFSPISKNYYFVDLDNDRIEEYIYVHKNDNNTSSFRIFKFVNNKFEFWKDVPDVTLVGFGVTFYLIDMNGDKLLDIILKNGTNNLVEYQILTNLNNGNFKNEGLFADRFGFFMPDVASVFLYCIDIDGDKDSDIIYVKNGNIYKITDQTNDRAVKGIVYWDVNKNMTYDSLDLPILGAKIKGINNNTETITSFSSKDGSYELHTNPDQYDITVNVPTDCWVPNSIDTTLVIPNEGLFNVNFGFILNEKLTNDISTSLVRSIIRCDRNTSYFYKIKNDGCLPIYGNLSIILDKRTFNIVNVSYTNFTQMGNELELKEIIIAPGSSFELSFVVTIPNPNFVGDKLFDKFIFNYDNIDGTLMDKTNSDNQESVIRCSYDPNDKLALPDRRPQFEKQYVLDEDITYIIRFQNTGNDTAFQVLLVDTLSELLDLSTFRPTHASHSYVVTLDERNRILKVLFSNILLPDSTTNQIGSNGFFSFMIKPEKELTEFTRISNKASIFFDNNTAVITEPVDIVFVSDLQLVDTSDPKVKTINLFPNPATSIINAEIFSLVDEVDVYSELGQFCKLKSKHGGTVDISMLKPGFYIVLIKYAGTNYYSKFVKL